MIAVIIGLIVVVVVIALIVIVVTVIIIVNLSSRCYHDYIDIEKDYESFSGINLIDLYDRYE